MKEHELQKKYRMIYLYCFPTAESSFEEKMAMPRFRASDRAEQIDQIMASYSGANCDLLEHVVESLGLPA